MVFTKISERDLTRIADRVYNRLHMQHFEPINSIELFLTWDCNLRCRYCFVGRKKKPSMGLSIAKEAVDFLVRESRFCKKISIVYFGGEPLLKFDLIKRVTFYAEKEAKRANKTVTFHMTTNGTLVNEKIGLPQSNLYHF